MGTPFRGPAATCLCGFVFVYGFACLYIGTCGYTAWWMELLCDRYVMVHVVCLWYVYMSSINTHHPPTYPYTCALLCISGRHVRGIPNFSQVG